MKKDWLRRAGRRTPRQARLWRESGALLVVLLLFVFALIESRNLTDEARLFPIGVAAVGTVLVWAALGHLLWSYRHEPDRATRAEATDDVAGGEETSPPDKGKAIRFWGWFAGFSLAIWGFGFYVGLPVAGAVFVVVESRRWVTAILVGVGLWVYLYWMFLVLLDIRWFTGVFL